MTHPRERTLAAAIKKACKWSPAVALLGMRQTGKTTLLKSLSASYQNFDDVSTIARFEVERTSLLENGPFPIGLDEVQKFPPLFDALKFVIDRKKTPGRYLMTGSVRFSSRKSIRESMTGRLVSFELFPMNLAECHSKELISFLDPFKDKSGKPERILALLEKRCWAKETAIDHYLNAGGLPGICFRRENAIRDQLFNGHLDTLLGRDISLLGEIRMSIAQLKELFLRICVEQGLPSNYSQLARQIGVSAPTIRKVLAAMEGLFLIRKHGKTYYSEDLGLASHACRTHPLSERQDLLRFLFREIKTNLDYCNPLEAELSEYRTLGGIDLPLVIHGRNGLKIAISADAESSPSEKSLKSLTYFRKKFKNTWAVAVHRGDRAYLSATGVFCLPRRLIC